MTDSPSKKIKIDNDDMEWNKDAGQIADLVNVVHDEINNYAPCKLIFP